MVMVMVMARVVMIGIMTVTMIVWWFQWQELSGSIFICHHTG